MMRILAVLISFAAASVASPIIGSGAWSGWPSVDNDGAPFWDNRSYDGRNCNVGYFLAGGFGPCSNQKNGTPSGGLVLGGANLQYYSAGGSIVPFWLSPGEWTFALGGRVAGSNTFEVGYFYPSDPGTLNPLFNQSDWVGNTATFSASQPFALYIRDGSYFLVSNGATLGVGAFRTVQVPGTYHFGFEDRYKGDWDFNDVVLTATYVPEPGTYALVGGGLLTLALLLRRRKS